MRLSEFLDPELVLIGLDTHGIEDTIGAMVGRLRETGHVPDPDPVRQAVIERERSHTTSLGNGVALPHANVTGVDRPRILVATAPDGVDFGPADRASDAEPDRLFFLLLSPVEAAGMHIKILARIVRLVRMPSFVDSLLEAGTGETLVAEIEREDARHV